MAVSAVHGEQLFNRYGPASAVMTGLAVTFALLGLPGYRRRDLRG